MPSTFSPDLRIELIGAGEQQGVWGTTTNTNLGTLIEDAIAGYVSVSVTSAAQAFTANDGIADQARNAMIALTTTTTADFAVYSPPASKVYVIYNTTAYAATIYNSTVLGNTTAAGTGVVVPAGKKTFVFTNGTNFFSVDITGLVAIADGGTGASTASAARSSLGLAIGTNVQAWDAELDVWATKTAPAGTAVGTSDTQTLTNKTLAYADNTLTGVAGVTATQTLTNKTLTNLTFDGSYTEDVYAIVDGVSVDLNPANGTIQTWTLGASRTATATSFAAGQSMTIMVNDGTAYTVTWPTTTWVGGSAPTLATTGYTVIELWKVSTTLYGAFVGYVA